MDADVPSAIQSRVDVQEPRLQLLKCVQIDDATNEGHEDQTIQTPAEEPEGEPEENTETPAPVEQAKGSPRPGRLIANFGSALTVKQKASAYEQHVAASGGQRSSKRRSSRRVSALTSLRRSSRLSRSERSRRSSVKSHLTVSMTRDQQLVS